MADDDPFLATTDALGRPIELNTRPTRIVSLVPSLTDLLHGLGLDSEVVGITRFCERPDGWRDEKTIVGGTKQVKQDTVAELAPDVVLANKEENTSDDVEALTDIAPVYVTDVPTVRAATQMIRQVGALVGRSSRAEAMAADITERFEALSSNAPLLRVAYLIWREPYMTVGGDTIIHDVMRCGGFTSPWADIDRYPEVTLNELADATLDAILCSSEPFPFGQKDDFTADVKAACPDIPVRVVDGQIFSWYGPRLLEAPAYLRRLRAELVESASG